MMYRKTELLLLLVLVAAVLSSCGDSPTEAPRETPGVETEAPLVSQFVETSKKLDEGGNMYLYVNVKGIAREWYESTKELFDPAGQDLEVSQDMEKIFGIADKVVDFLGVFDITDVGFSSVKIGPHYHVKTYVRIPEGRKGILTILGGAPHPCRPLAYAPPSTAYFWAFDLDVAQGFQLVRDVAADVESFSETTAFEKGLAKIDESLAAEGFGDVKLETLVNSLSGEFALVAEVDPENKINIPEVPGGPAQFPAPRLALMARVENSEIYDALARALKKQEIATRETVEGDLRKLSIPVPEQPYYLLDLVLAYDGEYLILASHGDYLDMVLKTKESPDNLDATEEYRQLMAGLPELGNCRLYVSQKGADAIEEAKAVYHELILADITDPTELKIISGLMRVMQKYDTLTANVARVRVNEEEGVFVATKTPQNVGAQAMLTVPVAVVAGVGLGVATAVPGFAGARQSAQANACMEAQKKMEGAIDTWALDSGASETAVPKAEDLIGPDRYIKTHPVCPVGKVQIQLTSVSGKVVCPNSIPSHDRENLSY